MKKTILASLALCAALSAFSAPKSYTVTSPDGALTAQISAEGGLKYSLDYLGERIIEPSSISMTLSDGTVFASSKILGVRKGSGDSTADTPLYRKAQVTDRYNSLTVRFKECSVEFRAYDEGFAWRFLGNERSPFKVVSELEEFNFAKDGDAWIPYNNSDASEGPGQFNCSFEAFYTRSLLSGWQPGRYAHLPMMVSGPGQTKICIAESDVLDYPGMELTGAAGPSLKAVFAPFPTAFQRGGPHTLHYYVTEAADYIAECDGAARSFPWRVICVAEDDAAMADNDMVYRLASPADPDEDFSWVRPGKAAWDWWCGYFVSGVGFKKGMNNDYYKYYIDFAAEYGLEYVLIDAGWFDEKTPDMLKVIPSLDMPELCRYAESKGVMLFLWTGYPALLDNMEEIFAHYSAMGIKGFKIDYQDRDDQIVERFLEECGRTAAKYHLALDFHGIHKPTGLQRRFPNILNYEGIKGMENVKWASNGADLVDYEVQAPFIRFVSGFAEYTQGAMRNKIKKNWNVCYSEPEAPGTRCRQMAEYVIFDSPFSMLCDSPVYYKAEPGFTRALAAIPNVWDETKVLCGRTGEYIAMARRKGSVWYVAGMTNWDARELTLDLSFISASPVRAELYLDGVNADTAATDWRREVKTIGPEFKVSMAPGGAFTARIELSDNLWYTPTVENKPYVRWWWLGSAVDRAGLTYNLEEFARAGLGGVEITPIYGVKGNEANDIPFLSGKWMEMYKFTIAKADSLGLQVDMNCGTGWPFGGPEITPGLAAQRMKIEDGALKSVQTGQMVKRAAPGGEGFVMNHFDINALKVYIEKFDKAFAESGASWPNTWFNDSYEVYGADWTPALPDIFAERYGYDIVEKLVRKDIPEDERLRALCDYRECLGDILYENFLVPWSEWAHSHGSLVRNQSHGSPANILDFYATVDIPECETFGRSEFDIPGLRRDPVRKPNDGDPCALKFASSAAHLTGKKYVSCETLTWLTEHFKTSLSQARPEIDQVFCSGVNHIFFHGAPYSPAGAEFPGWRFYASVNMSPTEAMWKDAPALFKYVERCQAFLTAGSPDSDFLLYMPIYDCWSKDMGQAFVNFDIHGMERTIPEVKNAMRTILAAGFDADYISDKLLKECPIDRPVIVPPCKYMPLETAQRLLELKKSGAKVYFIDRLPEDVPGLKDLQSRRKKFAGVVKSLGTPVSFEDVFASYIPETFKTTHKGNMIRRSNEAGGYNYFFTLPSSTPVDGWVKLAKPAASAVLFDAMGGICGKAQVRQAADGTAEVRMQMEPGQSLLLKTFPDDIDAQPWKYIEETGKAKILDKGWSINFPSSSPAIEGVFNVGKPTDWTTLDVSEAKINQGTARYATFIDIDPQRMHLEGTDDWILDLGDVRESAEVYINGQYVSTLVSVPFKVAVGKYLKNGSNTLEVYVTNLASNRIADYDRRGVEWRIFKDANVVNLGEGHWDKWPVDPSGLVSQVTLTPVRYSTK